MDSTPKPAPEFRTPRHYDVVIIGAGLAGLTLARHLLLETDRRILLLEKRSELPQKKQKLGESSVQLGGYYLSRVLDMEHHLMHEHFMKYNLRFYWRAGERSHRSFEDYSASYIRSFSNIASYQLDRNVFEGEVLRLNLEHERFQLETSVQGLEVELAADLRSGPHHLRFRTPEDTRAISADWVIDTTGRRQLLAKKRQLKRTNSIRHGSFFWWVDGLVDVERLTDLSSTERRLGTNRRHTGHLPGWLATNHFADEGMWLWVIPLRGKTSIGLVFDKEVVHWRDVFSVEKATRFVCERFPLLARDLPEREVLDFGGFKDFSYDCTQTLSSARWAMTGEAGRFSDPLYSPGTDLIAIHNTLIVDAIRGDRAGVAGDSGFGSDGSDLRAKCQLYESMMKAVYQAYVPSYVTSYDCLGDQECFSLKYGWELSIYFGLYVFPFVNDLFTDRRFVIGFLRQFSRLGPWNRGVQKLLSGFYQWKKTHRSAGDGPRFFDFTELGPLKEAEKTFYEVGVEAGEAKKILSRQVDQLSELARFLAVHVAAVVLDEPEIYEHRAFIESLDIENLDFDIEAFEQRWQDCRDQNDAEPWQWTFCRHVLDRFRTPPIPELRLLQEVAS